MWYIFQFDHAENPCCQMKHCNEICLLYIILNKAGSKSSRNLKYKISSSKKDYIDRKKKEFSSGVTLNCASEHEKR